MAFIHTIALNNEKPGHNTVSSTRRSERSVYGACLVATTTERSHAHYLAERAKNEKALADAKLIVLEALMPGETLEQLTERLQAENKAWYDAVEVEKNRLYAERGYKSDWASYSVNASMKARADAEAVCIERGMRAPFAPEGSGTRLQAIHNLSYIAQLIAQPVPAIGSQCVVSWHRDVRLAGKAISSNDAKYFLHIGDTITERTDITVRETKKRAPKEAARS